LADRRQRVDGQELNDKHGRTLDQGLEQRGEEMPEGARAGSNVPFHLAGENIASEMGISQSRSVLKDEG
jgi:hypothetical protein